MTEVAERLQPTMDIPQSWQERLAIINEFHLSNDQAVEVFSTTEKELAIARGLVEKGILTIVQLPDNVKDAWAQSFGKPAAVAPIQHLPTTTAESADAAPEQTPTKGTKRGRSTNKIATAFAALSTTPVPLEAFLAEHGVSKTILRQSKRFMETPIKVSIKKDKTSGIELISRA